MSLKCKQEVTILLLFYFFNLLDVSHYYLSPPYLLPPPPTPRDCHAVVHAHEFFLSLFFLFCFYFKVSMTRVLHGWMFSGEGGFQKCWVNFSSVAIMTAETKKWPPLFLEHLPQFGTFSLRILCLYLRPTLCGRCLLCILVREEIGVGGH